MDILGVGAAELIIFMLVLLVVAGPERSLLWARELGRYIRQIRQYLSELMGEFEKELGPDGREMLDVVREVRQNATDIRRAPQNTISKLTSEVAKMDATNAPAKPAASSSTTPSAPAPYEGWATPATDMGEEAPEANDTYEGWTRPSS